MFYIARWLNGEVTVAEARFEHLQDAKSCARERLPAHRVRKGATSAIVLDEDGVVYHRMG